MRTKSEILREVGNAAKESPRSGIIPDLADVLMIEVLIDIRDCLVRIDKSFGSNIFDLARES
jgi:hypothetical protein